jgi:poly(3-hydroxybutyrate) depolymerase
MADSFAAVGANAGAISHKALKECAAIDKPIPVQSFHSLADPTVPYNGTVRWGSQHQVDAMWKRRNGCVGTETPVVTFSSNGTTCLRTDCPNAPVETCTVRGLDHCWIGGRGGGFAECNARIGDVDATRHMFRSWGAIAAAKAAARAAAASETETGEEAAVVVREEEEQERGS